MSCEIKHDHVSDQLRKHSTLILNIPSLSKPTMFNIHHASTIAEIAQELEKRIINFVNGTWDAKREHEAIQLCEWDLRCKEGA
jgi:hypothetical protein